MEASPASPDAPSVSHAPPPQPNPKTAVPSKPAGPTKMEAQQQMYTRVAGLYESVMKLTSQCIDITQIYRNRPIWCQYPVNVLVEDARELYKINPTSRMAVHNFIGMLIHESTHQLFSQRESEGAVGVSFASVEEAALILMDVVQQNLQSKFSKQSSLDTLTWVCALSCELHYHNFQRPCSTQSQADQKSEQFLALMKRSKGVERMLEMLNFLVEQLLKHCPNECLSLLFDISRYGNDFNWIWLQISDKFPSMLVERLFDLAVNGFIDYVKMHEENAVNPMNPAMLAKIEEEWQPKAAAFAHHFAFLANKKNDQLLLIMSRVLEEGLNMDLTPTDGAAPVRSYPLLFLIRLILDSPHLFAQIIAQNRNLVSPTSAVRIAQQVLTLPVGCISNNWAADLDKVLLSLDPVTADIVIETLMRATFDPRAFLGFETSDSAIVAMMREGLLRLTSSGVDQLVRGVHAGRACIDASPAFTAFAHGPPLQDVIDWSIIHGAGRATLLQYLHAVAIAFGEEKGAEIAARFLVRANDEQELGVLLAFLYSVLPWQVNLTATLYSRMPALRRIFEEEALKEDPRCPMGLRWICNIRVLMQWDMRANYEDPLKYIGFYPGEHLGELLVDVLAVCIERCRSALQRGDKVELARLLLVVSRFLDACGYEQLQAAELAQKSIQVHKCSFSMRCLYKCAVQLATIVRFSLHLFGGGVPSREARDLLEQLRLVIFIFTKDKLAADESEPFFRLFVLSLTHGVLADSFDLFKDNVELDIFALPRMDGEDMEIPTSLIDEIRSLSLKQSVASLAHSGRIAPKKGGRPKNQVFTEDDALRLVATVDYLHSACIPGGEMSKEMAFAALKQLATALVECVCVDGLGADFIFHEWTVEKEAIARYVEISRKVDNSRLVQHLLALLTNTTSGLWLVLPIMKASLATILAGYENAVDRSKRPAAPLIEKTDKWIALAVRGQMLPDKLGMVMEMVPYVSCYEGFLLLSQIWTYFQLAHVSAETSTEMHKAELRQDPMEPMPSVEDRAEAWLPIVCRHIAELGHLVPLLLPRTVDDAIKART